MGFASAFGVGLLLRTVPDIGWSLILISAAVPAGIVFFIRMGIPESPRWLMQTGRVERAREIVSARIGANVDLPLVTTTIAASKSGRPSLVRNGMFRNTFIACMAYAVGTMPNFALGTFSPQVLTTLGVEDPYLGALGYNVCMAIGAFAGYFLIDRFGRKTLLFGGFLIAAALLAPMALVVNLSPTLSVALFAIFALIIVSTGNVVYAYPAELFPTEVRGRGVGLAVAASRLGSATVTFLLPILVASFGIATALGVIICLLVFGGVVGFIWGPETARRDLDAAARL
ncbi:MFS transporter [Microbacterium sp. ISL-103]|uniref:MFS transporter n=1 Tax=Microbacterium sp. ISL-103 TaxID=2819156 RepID=UPI00288B88DE|nr:MFS transporter [Microbacterium sp. ISL-103]